MGIMMMVGSGCSWEQRHRQMYVILRHNDALGRLALADGRHHDLGMDTGTGCGHKQMLSWAGQ